MTIEEELNAVQRAVPQLKEKLRQAAKNATIRAVETATDETPPNADSAPGTNVRTGELKQHWATDSVTEPELTGEGYQTILANNVQYASYVNDGHRMDKHFVPGLVLNPAGGIDMNATGDGGMMVGTRTSYVPGLFITDKAEETYNKVIDAEIEKITGEMENGN